MLHRCSKTLSPSSHDITREAEISTLSEKKNNLIGAHYAPHTHMHLKSWWFQNIQAHRSLRMMLPKKGPPLRQPSPRRAVHIFKQHSWFTAFHHVLFECCQNFHYAMTGFAMQMQVKMLFQTLRPEILCFCQSSSKNGCRIKILLRALVSRSLHVF